MPNTFICIAFTLKELIFTLSLNQTISPVSTRMNLTDDGCKGLLASINFHLSLFLPRDLG